jgi:hypothetical protein
MSYDHSNVTNNNPHHFIVLDAIARGIKSIDKIAKATRLPKEEVELVVNDLSLQRLILKEEKKRRFFGGNKLEIKVTETGQRMLNSKKQELQQQAEQLRQWNKPFMLFSGIMDILFFTSMMSMMGMALNPMESQMAADSGGGGAEGGAGETGTETDSSGAGFGESDAGGDFGGFDGGGFGDF